jgi:Family of unknown function (DUF6166)
MEDVFQRLERRRASSSCVRHTPAPHRFNKMKIYEGKRTMDGLVVTVDGKPLPEHYEVKRFTKRGFEWTYDGTSPQQLALAILFEHLGDKERAVALSEPFMKDVIANLDNDWRLTTDEIDAYLRRQEAHQR